VITVTPRQDLTPDRPIIGAMRNKRWLLLLLLPLAALATAAGYGLWLVRWLETPEFQQALLQRVRGIAGTEVRVERVEVSLLSGVTLEGVGVANPPPFTGDMLTAEGFILRYRLWPLVHGRFEVERLALTRPQLAVVMDARGAFNYERLGGSRPAGPGPAEPAAGGASAASPSAAPAVVPLRIVLSQLAVQGGAVTVTDATRARLLALDGVAVRSAFDVEAGVATGRGDVDVRTIDVAQRLFVRDVKAPLTLTKDAFTLSPIRGRAAGGEVRGETTVRFQKGFHYAARLEVKGADVKKLLAEARSAAVASGRLEAEARFEGTGGLATLRGSGKGVVKDCRLNDNRSLTLVASVLGVPELADPDFDECRAEFTLAGSRVTTPVLSLKSRALELTGHGALNLDTGALDYDFTLALTPALFAKVTRPELRPAFRTRPDGFAAIDFRLTGTTLAPKTDLLTRLGKAAATETVKGMVGRLFGRKRD
jgi:hypothetical protein